MNILIVDDEYYIVQGIASFINCEVLGISSIYTAYSFDQAKKIIVKESVDILITDIEMPRGNGLSLIEWIQENGYSIVPLILTGHQRFDYAQKAITMHCFSYILKPVDKISLEKELLKAITSIRERSFVAPAPVSSFSEKETDEFVRETRDYIRTHLSSASLNRDSLAKHIHMNPDYLSYLFHLKFGQTLSSYITSARIDKAKELLLHTTLSLNEISEQSGFSNNSYFHKQFKKATGITPQQYRSENT